jgi:uncharacterized protein
LSLVSLVLFGKAPRPGTVKTRLASALGAEGAAELAGAFLEDASSRYARLALARPVLAADPDPGDEFWRRHFGPPWTIAPQGDGDLGARLWRAFEREFHTCEKVCAVGADHPALPLDLFETFLSETGAVWPTRDGGYAAILLPRAGRAGELFEGIPWSTDRVLSATLERARAASIPLAVYPETYDVDEGADLDRLEEDLARRDPAAPDFPGRTWETLRKLREREPAR